MKGAVVVAVAICAVSVAGCWPWHKKTEPPQQQFMEALSRGNGAQASEIWRNMDAESRANWAHSEGMHPMVPPDEVKKQVIEHYLKEAGHGDDTGDASVENAVPHVGHGGLESLPEYTGPSGAPATVTVPNVNGTGN